MTVGRYSIARIAGFAACLVVAGIAAFVGVLQFSGNFHEVDPGRLYRAAQISPASIIAYQRNYGIRTIINLRGASAGAPWYDGEVKVAEKLGITHVDFRMSARRELDETQVKHIIGLLETAEKPILIHCNGGADRSGLIAALYVAAVAKKGEAAAERQLSVRYGHVPLWFLPEQAMDRTWEAAEDHLGFGGS